jgi:hypothetical protein
MSTPKPDANLKKEPTADDLAGTPVCKEEDQPTIRVRGSLGVKARGRGGKRVRGAPPAPPVQAPPTADDLAGIPVSVEGEEDVKARPRKPRRGE